MAIKISIFTAPDSNTQIINLDFVATQVAVEDDPTASPEYRYFLKFTTTARDTDDLSYTPRIVETMSDLVLNKTKKSTSNDGTPYTGFNDLVLDYLWDYMQGHTANQYSSGVAYKAPLKTTA